MDKPTPEKVDTLTAHAHLNPKFSPGQLLITPGALALLEEFHVSPLDLLSRHMYDGDWGDVSPSDGQLNDDALISGGRILSSYCLGQNAPIWPLAHRFGENGRIWLITEADRSATTILLPSEY